MDNAKIQAKFLKEAFKEKKKITLVHGEYNGLKIIGNPYRVFCFGYSECLLDMEILENYDYSKRLTEQTLESLLNTENDLPLKVEPTLIEAGLFGKRQNLRVLTLEETGTKIYINDEFYKEFTDKREGIIHFKGTKKYNQVSVWDDEKFIGIVMPVRYKEGE